MKKIVYNEYTNTTTTHLGAKILPTNLNDCLKKASNFVASNLNDFVHSEFCDNTCIIYNNNNIKDSKDLYNNVDYTNNVTKILCAMKKKAQHELLDIHFFPIKYSSQNENKEMAYVQYNLNNALYSMLVNFENWKWLVNATHCEFVVETCDVEKTLWFVANALSNNPRIKETCVNTTLNLYINNDLSFIAQDFRDFEKVMNWFDNMDKYIADRINFDKIDTNKTLMVYVYGEKDYGWREIVHKNGEMCLYFTPTVKKYLKRINKSMSGQKFHKYVNELLGKWFVLEGKAWDCFRQNMSRTIDDLDERIGANACQMMVEQYVNGMARFYDVEMVNEEDVSNEAIVKEEIETPVENNVVFVRETYEEAQKALEEKRKNEWKDIEIPDVNDPDFWSKL